MFAPITSALMIASLVIAQNPLPNPAAAPAAQQVPEPLVAPPITVPAGTAIPLTLMNAVKSKSTKPGDTVPRWWLFRSRWDSGSPFPREPSWRGP